VSAREFLPGATVGASDDRTLDPARRPRQKPHVRFLGAFCGRPQPDNAPSSTVRGAAASNEGTPAPTQVPPPVDGRAADGLKTGPAESLWLIGVSSERFGGGLSSSKEANETQVSKTVSMFAHEGKVDARAG
jgi:hypothetical protein